MKKRLRFYFLTAVVLLVLVFSAAHPLIVRADDSTPVAPASPAMGDTSAPATKAPSIANTSAPAVVTQAPPASNTSAPVAAATQPPAPVDTSAPATTVSSTDTSVAPADTSAPATAVASTDTSVAPSDTTVPATTVASTDTTVAPTNPPAPATTSPSTDAAPSATDTSAVLSQVPTGTQVVALDATGTAVPLATQAAADIVKTGDPMWCPTGQTPGGAGCTAAETTVASVITDLGIKTATAGTVYFTSSYSTNDATFDGSTGALSAWANYELTLQGGWNGSTGVSYALSGVSTFSVPITIENWNNNVIVDSIALANATDSITLDNINATGGQGSSVNASGNVTVENSQFNNSSGNGLTVTTGGAGNIKVHHVTSNSNSGDGAYLDNSSGTGAINVDTSTFGDSSGTNGNGSNGLEAYTNGNITLTDVTADGNYNDGALLDDPLTIWAISQLTAATSMITRELDTVATAPSLDALITLQVLKPMRWVVSAYPA